MCWRLPLRLLCPLLGAALMTACANSKPNPSNPGALGVGSPTDPNISRVGGTAGLVFVRGPVIQPPLGMPGIPVNPFLWRGALETLSFLPLTSADPFSGVIISDWASRPGTPGERVKATVYILGPDIRRDGVRVSVFRQIDKGGRWVDAAPGSAMAEVLTRDILDRAGQLRGMSLAAR